MAGALYRTAPVLYIPVLYCFSIGRCPVVPVLCTYIYFKHILRGLCYLVSSSVEYRLDRVKDEKKIKLTKLFGQSSHIKKSYEFVEQNRKMFRRPVWGPVGEYSC